MRERSGLLPLWPHALRRKSRRLLGQGRGLCGMALVLFLAFLPGAEAQQGTSGLYWQCVPPSTSVPQGAYCPVNTSYPLPQAASAAAVGGADVFRSVTLTNSAVAVKASAGTVSMLHVVNQGVSAAICYLHLYNVAAASVVVGTTVPAWSLVLAADAALTVPFNVPLQFGTAIAAAATTTAGGSTACSPILTLTEIVYK